MKVDVSELRTLAADLDRAAQAAPGQVKAVMGKAGVKMKAAMREEASGSRRFRRIPYLITYDLTVEDDAVEVEVGPVVGASGTWTAQGSLAHIAYFGSPTSGPVFPDPKGILDREAEAADRFLGDAARGLL